MEPRSISFIEKAGAFLRAISQTARPELIVTAGAVILLVLNAQRIVLRKAVQPAQTELEILLERREESTLIVGENIALRELKSRDISRFKSDLSLLTQSRRALYEGGLQLQEEKRLLEKQWEIMSTYLLIDEEAGKIHVMREEQSLESYPIEYFPAQIFGPQIAALAATAAIVSKERFAHPERGKSEEVNGQLQWEPPQVGQSIRSNALGEYVMFTKGPLILHGPPKKPEEHGAFAHYCLGLSLPVARRLYTNSYIGTKVKFKQAVSAGFSQGVRR
ncbi:MAG: hypothetical protein A3J74_00540 [Elusimicrobia bacterium RIFCSPHIGHO2_02_FULL_57_9]|nr:MAG: hypothetical protein A3J74_00540 [Elusimicrobia bacterium RIFCSPHIGHO2_02_FULL_57_9]